MKRVISFVVTVCIVCSMLVISVSANSCTCGGCISDSFVYRATATAAYVGTAEDPFAGQGFVLRKCHEYGSSYVESNNTTIRIRQYASVNISRQYMSSAGDWYYITVPEEGFAQGWVPGTYLYNITDLSKSVEPY